MPVAPPSVAAMTPPIPVTLPRVVAAAAAVAMTTVTVSRNAGNGDTSRSAPKENGRRGPRGITQVKRRRRRM